MGTENSIRIENAQVSCDVRSSYPADEPNSGCSATKTKNEPIARVTMRLSRSLWDSVQHRAIDEHISLSELVVKALIEYLKKGGKA